MLTCRSAVKLHVGQRHNNSYNYNYNYNCHYNNINSFVATLNKLALLKVDAESR